MALELLHSLALIVTAAAVIAVQKTRWIHSVAIGELVAAVLLGLLYAEFLVLPWHHTEGFVAAAMLAGWGALLVVARDKATVIPAAIATWITANRVLLELGWIRENPLRRLLEM